MQTLELANGANNAGEVDGNCCSRLLRNFSNFIWRNEAEQINHLKAAPCVSTRFLAILRFVISIALVGQTISCIIKTSAGSTSFFFISQWNLLLITILFTTMAVIQIKHEKRLTTFTVDVKPLKMTRTNSTDNRGDYSPAMVATTD